MPGSGQGKPPYTPPLYPQQPKPNPSGSKPFDPKGGTIFQKPTVSPERPKPGGPEHGGWGGGPERR